MQLAVLLGLLGATMVAGEWALRVVQHRGQRRPLSFPTVRESWLEDNGREGGLSGRFLSLARGC